MLEEALTQATEQISQLENTADQLRIKLREEENPEQLKVRNEHGRMIHLSLKMRKYQRILLESESALRHIIYNHRLVVICSLSGNQRFHWRVSFILIIIR